MNRFTNLEQLQKLVSQMAELPFDDDRVEIDTIENNTLTINFNNVDHKTTVDDDGVEREVFKQLVIEGVTSFKIVTPDDATHFLRSVDCVGDNRYEIRMAKASWIVELDGNIHGRFGEKVDDTDFEMSISMSTIGVLIGLGVLGIAIVIAGIYWVF